MGTPATDHAIFETFYKDVRGRLLLQTWALTGDLPAAQKAVRDGLIISWHHWRKVRDLEAIDKEDWVRPLAWSRAQRRHSVPHLHRTKGVDPDVKATLTALGKLSITQRKVLILAHLSSVSLEQLAREVGITRPRAERELQAATAAFCRHRGVAPTEILPLFEPMAAVVAEQRWPRPTILTRAGSARRRTHTLVGAAVAVAALAGTGFFVAHSGSAEPRLDSLSLHSTEVTGPTTSSAAAPTTMAPQDLLSPDEVGKQLGGAWATEITSDNTSGSGLVIPCQRARFADKGQAAALIRTFTGPAKGLVADQAAETSRSSTAAEATYKRTIGWYAGCNAARTQLLATQRLTGVGDDAMVFGLRDWSADRAVVVAVARSGRFTTSVATTTDTTLTRALPRATDLLGSAVVHLCTLPGHGACTADRVVRADVPPLAVGSRPGLLGAYDLPPVKNVDSPWVGTKPEKAKTNLAATRCDQTSFTGKRVTAARTRTFVIPDATNVSAAFGLTETVGKLDDAKSAAAFVATIKHRLATCGDRQLGSHVTSISTKSGKDGEVSVWRVRVETSKSSSVVFLMAAIRQGSAVAQLGFTPTGKVDMDPAAFVALAGRAADRLALL